MTFLKRANFVEHNLCDIKISTYNNFVVLKTFISNFSKNPSDTREIGLGTISFTVPIKSEEKLKKKLKRF